MRSRLRFVLPTSAVGILSLLFLFALVGCGDGDAPEGDVSEQGDSAATEAFRGTAHLYDMTIAIDQTVEMNGAEMGGTMGGSGTMTLTAGEKTDKGMRWQAVTSVSMGGDMMGTAIDTVKQEQTMIYLVSPQGKLLDMELSGVDTTLNRELTRMIQNTSSRQSAMQMFMPEEWLNKTVGDSWEEESLDTINADDVTFGQGMTGNVFLVTRTKTRYTYEGTVDTLGTKAARLKYELLEMELSGQMEGKGLDMTLSSNGNGSGVYYYALDDRLQLVSTSDLTTSTVISMPSMNQTMPMKQHIVTSLVRRTAGK